MGVGRPTVSLSNMMNWGNNGQRSPYPLMMKQAQNPPAISATPGTYASQGLFNNPSSLWNPPAPPQLGPVMTPPNPNPFMAPVQPTAQTGGNTTQKTQTQTQTQQQAGGVPGQYSAGEGGPDLANGTTNTLLADALGSGGQILGTVIGKQFQDWSTGGSSGLNAQAIEQAQKMGELNNQLKKAGTFATNAMGYKGAGAQISAKNAMAGFQPDAEDVMARNQANKQADQMTSNLNAQMNANNTATNRQAGRAVNSTINASKQMGGPASLGAAATAGAGQALGTSLLQNNAQNAQALTGANQTAAGMRTNAAQQFDQAKNSAFKRKVEPYMNQWHEPGSESAINTGSSSSSSSSRQAGEYPIYDLLAGTAQQLGTRGSYQASSDMHRTSGTYEGNGQKEQGQAEPTTKVPYEPPYENPGLLSPIARKSLDSKPMPTGYENYEWGNGFDYSGQGLMPNGQPADYRALLMGQLQAGSRRMSPKPKVSWDPWSQYGDGTSTSGF